MLTIEMKINGTVIGQIYAHNEGYTGSDDECLYKYHCYMLGNGYDPTLQEGELVHNRNEGFLELGAKLFINCAGES